MQKSNVVEHVYHEDRVFKPKNYEVELREYEKTYQQSIENPSAFWLSQAALLDWTKEPKNGCEYSWDISKREVIHTWFADGSLNATVNCLDRHLEKRGSQPALIWQGDEDADTQVLTYQDLYDEVCRFGSVLKKHGVGKGDRVCLYMPMVPALAIAVLACARIGAIHSVVFGGFSSDSLRHRIDDCAAKLLVTADIGYRGGKTVPLKQIADKALKGSHSIEKVIVYRRGDGSCPLDPKRDLWWHDEMNDAPSSCEPAIMSAEDPLFILYTSGSTGKPKGVVHTTGGYLLYAMVTHKHVFAIEEGDIYWCTADIGWITGHSYVLYGPLANGTTTLLFEGVPTYPDPGRFWQIVEKYGVTKFYTAPTAIRSLLAQGAMWPRKYDISSLSLLGTVGEPINPEAWMWYYEIIGESKCPVIDTWWQTETGGILITPLPKSHPLKPGSATKPFFGIDPVILRDDGNRCSRNEGGSLCIKKPWPGLMRTTWGDHDRFIDTYFTRFPNFYYTGDSCYQDDDGDYWLLGRMDDVVNISGHRLGTAEVESALVSHPDVAEAAVVPVAHAMKGQSLIAFVVLVSGKKENHDLKIALRNHVKEKIGAIAAPEEIRIVKDLPKTRSGKIMRRILRKIAEGNITDLGDTSTLASHEVLEDL